MFIVFATKQVVSPKQAVRCVPTWYLCRCRLWAEMSIRDRYAFLDDYERIALATTPDVNPYWFVEETWRGKDNLSILLHTHFESIGKFKLPIHVYAYADLLQEIVRRKRDIDLDMYERKALLRDPTQNPYSFLKDVWRDHAHKSIILRFIFRTIGGYELPVLGDEDASALLREIFKRKDLQLQNHAPAHREPHMPQFSHQYVATPPRPQQYVTPHVPQFSQQYATPHVPQQHVTPHKSPFTLTPPSAAWRYEEIEQAPEGYTDDWIKDGRVYSQAQKYEYSEYYYRKRAWRYTKEPPRYPGSPPMQYNPFHEGDEAYNARDAAYQQERSAFFKTYKEQKENFLTNPKVIAAMRQTPFALRDYVYGPLHITI